jgi:hypothetical protein
MAPQCARQHGGFLGQFGNIAARVAAEGVEVRVDVVENQRQRAQGESGGGDQDNARPQSPQHRARVNRQGGQADAGDHPHGQGLVPQRQAEQEAPGREAQQTSILGEAKHQEHGRDDQQVLERHRSPIEAGGEEITGVGGEQYGAEGGGARSGDAAQQKVEGAKAARAGQQHGLAQGPDAGAEAAEQGLIEPGLETAQVTHEHDGRVPLKEGVVVDGAQRGKEGPGEKRLVVLNADQRQEGLPSQQKEKACGGQQSKFAPFYRDHAQGVSR